MIDQDFYSRTKDLTNAREWLRHYTWMWNGVTYCSIQSLSRLHNDGIVKAVRVWRLTTPNVFPVPIICEVNLEAVNMSRSFADAYSSLVTLVDMTDQEFTEAVGTHAWWKR